VQVTLIQLDNYGPWTETLGNDREPRLQVLQSDLYSEIEKRFAEKDGLVFFNRFDEMLAISNGITEEEHEAIKDGVQKKFPVTTSMSIGVAENPFLAQVRASKLLQEVGSAQSPTRRGALASQGTLPLSRSHVQVAHFDIDGVTQSFTDRSSAYETSLHVMTLYVELMRLFKEQDALLFFIGGDNFMGVANGLGIEKIESMLAQSKSRGTRLKCGIGIAKTGRRAAELATMNLDRIRNSDGSKPILSTTDL